MVDIKITLQFIGPMTIQDAIERFENGKMGKEEQPCMLNLILSVDGSKWGRENRELTTLRDIDGQKGNAS